MQAFCRLDWADLLPRYAPGLGHGAHVFRPGAATTPNPLRSGAPPTPSEFDKRLYLSLTLPTAMHGIPLLAGIWIDDDGFACNRGQLADEAADKLRSGAIDADPYDLELPVKQLRARAQGLSMGDVRSIPAGEAEVRGHVRVGSQCSQDGLGFLE